MPQTVIEKIASRYLANGQSKVHAGDFVEIRPKHVMTHDNTAAVMKKFKGLGAGAMADASQPVWAMDHDIQNRSEANLAKYESIRSFAGQMGVDYYRPGTGISHQVMCEKGYVTPDSFVVGSDSHSNMYGALGALGTPVVRTDAAAIWATGTFWWQVLETVEVELLGELPDGATGKDLIITLCGLYNSGEVLNRAVEFTGPGVAKLSIDERMSIANMTTEWGALVGFFPCDERTVDWLARRLPLIESSDRQPYDQDDLDRWAREPLRSDEGATYAGRVTLDLAQVTPHVSGPDSVQVMTSLAAMETRQQAIHKAYIVSCVNSRLSDLEAASKVLDGKKVAQGVELYVAAASATVLAEAEERGIWSTLISAGARPLPPGCGPCIGLGTGLLEAGEVGISATNRNFKGRMGDREAQCYLASPEVVAASAIAGYIRGPKTSADRVPDYRWQELESQGGSAAAVEILDGFPSRISGRLVFLTADNLNTDGIYAGAWTYREDMTPEKMAAVVFENYDQSLVDRLEPGDIIVAGRNFGTGSSREQAATALLARKLPLIVAASYSQTYLRNAFNNGLPCSTSPAFISRLRGLFSGEISEGALTVLPGDELEVDFSASQIHYRGEVFSFSPMSQVPQSLVIAGGIENLVRKRLAE